MNNIFAIMRNEKGEAQGVPKKYAMNKDAFPNWTYVKDATPEEKAALSNVGSDEYKAIRKKYDLKPGEEAEKKELEIDPAHIVQLAYEKDESVYNSFKYLEKQLGKDNKHLYNLINAVFALYK